MGPGGSGTKTGKILENMIKSALIDNGYGVCYQKYIGKSLFNTRYKADFVVSPHPTASGKCDMKSPEKVIISCKWQQVAGTAEQKLLYEIATLIKIIKESNNTVRKAYVVLGGHGFRRETTEYFFSQRHREVLKDGELVEILSMEDMVAKINKREL